MLAGVYGMPLHHLMIVLRITNRPAKPKATTNGPKTRTTKAQLWNFHGLVHHVVSNENFLLIFVRCDLLQTFRIQAASNFSCLQFVANSLPSFFGLLMMQFSISRLSFSMKKGYIDLSR